MEHISCFRAFPRLEEGGGFEILRTEEHSRSSLMVACVGACTVDQMLQISTGRIYIRPIQKSIPLDENKRCLASSEMEECMTCGCLINLVDLRKHIRDCRVGLK